MKKAPEGAFFISAQRAEFFELPLLPIYNSIISKGSNALDSYHSFLSSNRNGVFVIPFCLSLSDNNHAKSAN